jgi:hypothetical protein
MREVKGLKWGVLIGSVIMTLSIGPAPYLSETPFPFFGYNPIVLWFWGFGLPIIAGVVAGGVTGGSGWKRILAGILCAIPIAAVIRAIPLWVHGVTEILMIVGLPIAVMVAGLAMKGSRRRTLAGILCAIPATMVYWYVLGVAHIGDGLVPPAMGLWAAGLGAVGGLISCAIKA